MKITALIAAVGLSAGIAVMDAVAIIHGSGSWWILIAACFTFSASFATLWGEVVDR